MKQILKQLKLDISFWYLIWNLANVTDLYTCEVQSET
jgi:hypothetical protein